MNAIVQFILKFTHPWLCDDHIEDLKFDVYLTEVERKWFKQKKHLPNLFRG